MVPWRRNLAILWAGCFLTACSFSLVMPFLPVFLAQLGVRDHLETWAGATFAVTFVSSTVMAPVWGNLADRHGRKIMVVRSGLSIGLIYLLMSMAASPWHVFGLRLLNGVFSGFIPSSIALVATNTPEDRVGRALAVLATAQASGQILGPTLGGALSDWLGIRSTMRVAAAMMAVATLLALVGVREAVRGRDRPRTSVLQDVRTALGHPVLFTLLTCVMLVQAAVMSVEPILTLHIQGLRQDPWLAATVRALYGREDAVGLLAGAVFSLPAVAAIFAAPLWARWGERVGFPTVVALGLSLSGCFVIPQALAGSVAQLAALRLAFGLSQAAVQPAVNATIATAVDPSFRGRAYGIQTSATFIGSVTGPIVGGLIASYAGSRWVFLFTGAALLAASLWVRRGLLLPRPALAPPVMESNRGGK